MRTVIAAVLLANFARFSGDAPFGKWTLDKNLSHLYSTVLVIRRAEGGYKFDFGATSFIIVDDGKFYSAFGNRSTSLTVLAPNEWRRIHRLNGMTVDTSLIRITADQKRMLIDTTATGDGRQSSEVMDRIGAGSGLAGAWKSAESGADVTKVLDISPGSAPGQVHWAMPENGQYYLIRFDGHQYPLLGPKAVSGVTIAFQSLSGRHWRWTEYLNGRPYMRGDDFLRLNGRLLVERTWPVQRPSERQEAVYTRS